MTLIFNLYVEINKQLQEVIEIINNCEKTLSQINLTDEYIKIIEDRLKTNKLRYQKLTNIRNKIENIIEKYVEELEK